MVKQLFIQDLVTLGNESTHILQLKTEKPTKGTLEPSLTCDGVANILTVHEFNDVGLSYYQWHANSIPAVSECFVALG